MVKGLYLVVKATLAIEVVEECRIGLSAPKVHIGNLKIAPNCVILILHLIQELEGDGRTVAEVVAGPAIIR